MTFRPRVLMLADACNPEWHSLPALIYRYFTALLPYCDITLVTQVRNRANIEKERLSGVTIEYLDTEAIAGPMFRAASFLSRDPNKAMTLKVAFEYPSYLYFEWRVWSLFKERIKAGAFDLVHRLSPMSPTIPSPMASWCPIPFVVGPILGGLAWPPQFAPEMRREGEWMNYLRNVHRRLPFYQATYAKASAILAAYEHTISDLPAGAAPRIIEFSEGGIDPQDYPRPERTPQEKVRVLFVGRLVPFKCPEVLVQSFANSPLLRNHKLIIVGDGPERPRLERLIAQHGLADCVELRGTVRQSEVIALMSDCEIFAFPSIREQGGGVLTMASMCEMACVVVKYGGPKVRIPKGCGERIPMGTIPELVERFTQALEALVRDPERVRAYGRAARKFTQAHYSWDSKAKKTLEIYEWVLQRRTGKPDYWDAPTPSRAQLAAEAGEESSSGS